MPQIPCHQADGAIASAESPGQEAGSGVALLVVPSKPRRSSVIRSSENRALNFLLHLSLKPSRVKPQSLCDWIVLASIRLMPQRASCQQTPAGGRAPPAYPLKMASLNQHEAGALLSLSSAHSGRLPQAQDVRIKRGRAACSPCLGLPGPLVTRIAYMCFDTWALMYFILKRREVKVSQSFNLEKEPETESGSHSIPRSVSPEHGQPRSWPHISLDASRAPKKGERRPGEGSPRIPRGKGV